MPKSSPKPSLPDAHTRSGKPLPERTRQAIVAKYALSGNMVQVAQDFGVHRNTVWKIIRGVKQDEKSGFGSDPTERITSKAYRAVEEALDCKEDKYKAGELGNKVLIGVGKFKSGQEVNVGVQVNQCPSELLSRMIETPGLREDVVEREADTTTSSDLLPNNGAPDVK